MTIASGTHLGRYEIRSQLGSGGMGEVYLAQDTKLERTVALKLLPAEIASDSQRMHRFIQEAKAASALNHPNILTIHEVDHIGSTNFIATEFIDGETLRQRMRRTRMSVQEALDVAIQVATALAAAHEAGIIHRDIKPENIMLRKRDGIVKVLDFGLAKLKDRMVSAVDMEAATRALVNTAPGTVIGTATYMSPEQARGLDVDERTDLWSLGIVLYEMLTGHVPFTGSTATDVIAAIVKTEPSPVSEAAPEVPARLEEIVLKALEKDREDRYQTVKDLLVDLRRLRKRLDIESGSERSVPPGPRAPTTSQTSSQTVSELVGPTSSAEYLVSKIRSHKIGATIFLAVLVIALSGIAFGLYKFIYSNRPAAPSDAMKITRLTSIGNVTSATISPDAKYVAYAVRSGPEGSSIWVRQVATTSNVQVVPPSGGNYYFGLTFSPDGNFVYYISRIAGGFTVLYQMPVLGGGSRKVIEHLNTPISFSPDGKQFAFIRNRPEESALMVANTDGGGEQTIATRKSPASFGDLQQGGAAWSPDGRVIACIAKNSINWSVVEIPARGGAERPITSQTWAAIGQPAWLPDGSALIMTGADEVSKFLSRQVWYLSYPSGAVRKISNDLNFYSGVSISSDSSVLLTVQTNQSANIWIVAEGDSSLAKQITSGASNLAGSFGIAWTPDDRIVYHSTASGSEDIWIMEADGTGNRQLTVNASANFLPSVCPDGRYIVFVSDRGGTRNIWRMDLDGSNQKKLAAGNFPQCTPDGRSVIFGSGPPKKMSIDGGEPVQLTDKGSTAGAAISPDGKMIAAHYVQQPDIPAKIAIIPIEGGEPVKLFDASWPSRIPCIRWTADGRAVTYVANHDGVDNIWSQPIDGGPPKQLTNFKSDEIFRFDWSRDGKRLVLSRGVESRDIVLIRDFR